MTVGAEKDLENIVEFISTDKPGVAERAGSDIVKHLRMLENFPRLGSVVPEFGEELRREIIHSPDRLIYEINHQDHRIEVVLIWLAASGQPDLGTGQ